MYIHTNILFGLWFYRTTKKQRPHIDCENVENRSLSSPIINKYIQTQMFICMCSKCANLPIGLLTAPLKTILVAPHLSSYSPQLKCESRLQLGCLVWTAMPLSVCLPLLNQRGAHPLFYCFCFRFHLHFHFPFVFFFLCSFSFIQRFKIC